MASGRVRVVVRVGDGRDLKPGKVLVTTSTKVGWTPLFPLAAGIVTDVGAPLSHAAIMARELGIPAVGGCGDPPAAYRILARLDSGRGPVELGR